MSFRLGIKDLLFTCLCAVLFVQQFYAQTEALPRGVVIDSVACLENKDQSYSLYLPSKYTADKKWPILYVFDPFAHGKVPADIFREAAEKYSYIIAASNNSKNGLGGQQQSDIITTLWKDTHARFSLDEKRAYAAGLSGGARVANYFAYSCKGCVAGVIASGAAFPPALPFKDGLPYAFFGTTGVDDFNYGEMIQVDKTLSEISAPHRLATFDAGHQWLTPALTFDALEWFDLQAMKTGRLEKNAAFIESIFSREKNRAEVLLQSGKILEAWRGYRSLVADLTGLAETGEIAQKLAQLSGRKELKDALKQEESQIKRQAETLSRVITLGAGLLDINTKQDAVRRLSAEVGSLKKMSEEKEDSGDRRYARRTLFGIFAHASESAQYLYLPQKDYKSAAANFELAALVYPASQNIQFNLARVLALDGKKKEAIAALGRAAENGFKDCAVLAKEGDFSVLRTDKDFLKLKTSIGCNN